MQAGTAHIGRTILAAVTAAALVLSMAFMFASPADASGEGSPAACETGIQATGGEDLQTYTAPSGKIVDGVCIKAGQLHTGPLGNGTHEDGCYLVSGVGTPTATVTRLGDGPGCQGISHVDVIVMDQPTTTSTEPTTTTSEPTTTTSEPTTTTSEPTTTTSTTEPTTTTSEPTTTTSTTEPTTTTSEPTTTTSTTEPTTTTSAPIGNEVRALVFVTVEGTCIVTDGKGEGEIEVTISVDDAATVVIRDGSGAVVANVTSDAVLTVPEDDTYTWEAAPSDGFEFAEDFVSGGEVDIEECTPTEVKDLEVLPFTGAETRGMAVIAAVLSAIGLLVILATRRVEE